MKTSFDCASFFTKLRKIRIKGLRCIYTLNPRFNQLHTVSFLELIDTSTGINQLLLARKERMAVAADIHFQYVAFFRRTRFEGSAARASNRYFVIFGVYISFHYFHLAVRFLF